MQFRPNKLALLISLIGAGVSPYAYARSDLRVTGPAQSPLSIALDESATWAAAPAWREEDGGLELVKLPDELQYSIWVPPSNVLAPEEAADEAQEPPSEFSQRDDNVVSEQTAAPRPAGTSAAQPAPNSATTHAERLMESLAAVVLEDVSGLDSDAALSVLAEQAPGSSLALEAPYDAAYAAPHDTAHDAAHDAAYETPAPHLPADDSIARRVEQREIAAPPADRVLRELEFILSSDEDTHDAPPADEPIVATNADKVLATLQNTLHLEQREIVVAPPAHKVLRDLEFVLSSDKIRLGTYGTTSANETIVTTHADKVLATLQDISSAQRASEDPAERRARKFAAAQARAEAAAAIAAELDIDLTQMMPVERMVIVPALLPSAPTDGAAVALAMEPGPMQSSADARYVSTIDLELEETAQSARPSPFGSEKVAINARSLDRIRGGFIGDGLSVSFGIERAVYINGTLVTTTSLNISDLGRITAGRGTTTSFDSGTLALIQSGAGNTVTSGTFSSTSIGTVVQNTLNGQKIQSVTVINATANSLGVLRGLNLQSTMRGAMIDSLRR